MKHNNKNYNNVFKNNKNLNFNNNTSKLSPSKENLGKNQKQK